MRITSSMIASKYLNNLMKSANALDKATTKSTNYRNYQTASEDPSSSSKSSILRRDYAALISYQRNADTIDGQLKTIDGAMSNVDSMLLSTKEILTGAITGTQGETERYAFAAELKSIQSTILQELNTSFGGKYLFGGTQTSQAPFSIDPNTSKLLYRGLDLDDPANQTKLEELSKESLLIDLGYGIDVNNPASGFDTSFPGINVIGFGTDSNGKSLNIYNALNETIALLESPDFNIDQGQEYLEHFHSLHESFLNQYTVLGAKENTIDYAISRLEKSVINLADKIQNLEFADVETATIEFKTQTLEWEASLLVGTQILQKSFLDYLS